MFSRNFKKSFTGNWNWKMEPGNESFGGYLGIQVPGTALLSVNHSRISQCYKSDYLYRCSRQIVLTSPAIRQMGPGGRDPPATAPGECRCRTPCGSAHDAVLSCHAWGLAARSDELAVAPWKNMDAGEPLIYKVTFTLNKDKLEK